MTLQAHNTILNHSENTSWGLCLSCPPSPGAKSQHLEISSFPSSFSYMADWKMNSFCGSKTFKGNRKPTLQAGGPFAYYKPQKYYTTVYPAPHILTHPPN